MNNIEKIQLVMNDKEFVEKIGNMEDPVDVQKAFEEKEIIFSLEEINQIAEIVMGSEDGELTEGQMETVTGGILSEIAIVASGVALFANTMSEINKNRKAAGKSTIW